MTMVIAMNTSKLHKETEAFPEPYYTSKMELKYIHLKYILKYIYLKCLTGF